MVLEKPITFIIYLCNVPVQSCAMQLPSSHAIAQYRKSMLQPYQIIPETGKAKWLNTSLPTT